MPLILFRRKNSQGKPTGNFVIRGTLAGQSIYESTGVSDKKAAEIIRVRRSAEIIERATLGKSATLTFAEAALTYMESGGETRFIGPLLLHFGEKTRLAHVDNEAANKAARAILMPDAAPATINRQIITPISAIYNLAADDGHVTPRRFRRRKEPQSKIRWLTPGEAEDLLEASEPHLLPIVTFLLGTGCRTSEALGLQCENLHLETRQALIPTSKNGELKMAEFPARVMRLLAASGLPEAGAVFRTPKGQAYKLSTGSGGQIEAAFTKARVAAKLGVDVTPHTLRHTFATWHYAMNKDLLLLMTRGGWKKPDMALKYAKLAPADLPEKLLAHGWDFRTQLQADQGQKAIFGAKIRVIK
ncbi:site-specific integrase [Leisingera daeponensis]|nr:site-specific integrase [Leisingera daeponensis]